MWLTICTLWLFASGPQVGELRNAICHTPSSDAQRALLQPYLQKTARMPEVRFRFPLERQNKTPFEHALTVFNYVDHNAAFPNQIRDYQNGTRSYDLASGYNHSGTDYSLWPFWWTAMDAEDMAVVAAADGVIVAKLDGQPDTNCALDTVANWNAIYVQHDDGTITIYGHLKRGSLLDKVVGEPVSSGEFLGFVGSSGRSSGPHLHFEVWDAAGNVIDPYFGPGNPTISESLWLDQPEYVEPQMNSLTLHSGEPVFACYEDDAPQFQSFFSPGDSIFVVGTFRDPRLGQMVDVTVYGPDDRIWVKLDPITFDQNYDVLAYLFWVLPNSQSMVEGIYRVEAQFEDQRLQTHFAVGRLEAPAFTSVSVSPANAVAGEPVTISWSTERAVDVALTKSLGFGLTNDSVTFVPEKSGTVGLLARGPGGQATEVATVEVVEKRRIWVPHLTALGGGFESELRFKSEECCVTQVTVVWFSALGEVLPGLNEEILPGEEIVLERDNRPESAAYAVVESDMDLAVTVSYRPASGGSPALWQGTDQVGQHFETRRGDPSSVWDGLAIVNLGDADATLELTQVSADGLVSSWAGPSSLEVAPGVKRLLVLNDGLPFEANAEVRLKSNQPIVVTALRGSLVGCEPYLMWGSPIWQVE